jgi:hypothetical protein
LSCSNVTDLVFSSSLPFSTNMGETTETILSISHRSRPDREQDLSESGIGDLDGLLEQVGTQDWQQGGMG